MSFAPSLILVLLKAQFGPIQNGPKTVRFGYGSARLLNRHVWLRITIYANINRLGIVYKRAYLAREPFIFLKLKI